MILLVSSFIVPLVSPVLSSSRVCPGKWRSHIESSFVLSRFAYTHNMMFLMAFALTQLTIQSNHIHSCSCAGIWVLARSISWHSAYWHEIIDSHWVYLVFSFLAVVLAYILIYLEPKWHECDWIGFGSMWMSCSRYACIWTELDKRTLDVAESLPWWHSAWTTGLTRGTMKLETSKITTA